MHMCFNNLEFYKEIVKKLVWILLICLLCFKYGCAEDDIEFQKSLPDKIVWGVPETDAELPCDITPPLPSDNVTMIFWFKDTSSGMPIYSVDARKHQEVSHLAISDDRGNRTYFIIDDDLSKARLKIKYVNIHDQGVYRCRVDFTNSPTRNFQVNLTLIEQPSAPRLFDAEGREIKPNSSAGPFLEGEELFLSCQVNGGRPRPQLSWWLNNTILDNVIDTSSNSFTTVNQLLIPKVSRKFKGKRLECRATSAEAAGYRTKEVPLIVYLKPNKVKIVTPNELMSNRKSHNVKCETSGSYPPAKLTWLLDGRPIKQSIVTEEETDSFTGSILTMSVSAEDDGKELVCRADNPRFPGGTTEDRRQIHVAYPPRVSVQLDSAVPLPVKEGTEIRLRCESVARPTPDVYRWYHDGHLIDYNETAGIFPIDDSLRIRNVEKKLGGQYACSATNSEGETYSAPFDLVVQFPPRCKKGYEHVRVGSIPYKELIIQCHVEAIPEVNKFFWTYNTGKDVLRVQGAKMQNQGGVSTLYFTPGTDYLESLSCWASNEVGRQELPCLFYIIPAETPESPRNCIIQNTSTDGLGVMCRAGKDGGLHQSFVLEVSDVTAISGELAGVTTLSDQGERSPPVYRVLGEEPKFKLHSLEPGREYQVSVYAENARGKSTPPEVLPTIKVSSKNDKTAASSGQKLLKDVEQQRNSSSLTPIIVALAASAVILILGIVTAATVLACRKRPRVVLRQQQSLRGGPKPPEEFELNSEVGFGEGFHRRSAQYRASMYSPTADVESRISRIIEGPDLIMYPASFNNEENFE